MNLSKKFYVIVCLICVLGIGLRIYDYYIQSEKVDVGQNFAKQNSEEKIIEKKEGNNLIENLKEENKKNEEEFVEQNILLKKQELKKIKLLAPKNNEIYFGAFPDFGGSEERVESKIITDFEKMVGKKITWAYFSQNWWQGMEFPKEEIQKIRDTGAIPFVRFMPRSSEIQNGENEFKKENKFSLQNIIDGKFDKELKSWAQEARKDGQPILVDFAVEPNGYWFLWSGKHNGGGIKGKYGDLNWPDGPERWRDAYRHIIDLFKKEKVNNITWFFHADLTGSKEEWNLPKYYYPGDNYIDWIGFSFYGPQNDKEKYWDKFSEIWKENYKMITDISSKKPLAILEIGVSDNNPYGDKAKWYDDAFKTILKNPYAKFFAVNFWNENWENENESKALIKIDSSKKSLESFKKNIKNSRFIYQPRFSNFTWKRKNKMENFAKQNFPIEKESEEVIKEVTKSWYQPKPKISWQWQLEGNIKTDFDVDLYDLDLFDTPQSIIDELHKKDKKVICYFNAGAWEPYRDDSSKFPKEVLGKIMEGWEDERWLDIKNYEKFSSLILARLDLAKKKKCDGVEPDNIDGFQNKTGFSLNYTDQLNFNKWLAKEAHKRNLSIALKNDLDQVKDLVNNFDFAINEECFGYDECEKLLPFIKNNKAVLGVEYILAKSKFCSKAKAMKFSWIKMKEDYLLDGFRDSCE